MRSVHRRMRASAAATLGLAVCAATLSLGNVAASAVTASSPAYAALARSVPVTSDPVTGAYRSRVMTVEVALTPRDAAGLASTLREVYTKGSRQYHHWLRAGQFNARYAPGAAEHAAVAAFLRGAGLTVRAATSPFLVAATGSSAQVSAAFRTRLNTYRDPTGNSYFQNSTAVWVPAAIEGEVQGVIGLTNTIRERSMIEHAKTQVQRGRPADASCDQPYPTTAQLVDEVLDGTPVPFGYGAGPGCQGLTPQQDNSIYGAPHVGGQGKGKGVAIGVFELSAYQHSDIDTWSQTFGQSSTPSLTDVTVDGGPLNPQCPAGDSCPPAFNGYSGDITVDADIEMQLAIAPDVTTVMVYNAPNDTTGQTSLDEWTAIADDDEAASVNSSWGTCENDVTSGYVQAENTIFEQMALQGQSVFGDEGNSGAFGCIRSDGTTITNVMDPASQPWVTSVGGTSLESFNPGQAEHPGYRNHTETVWNTDSLCSTAGSGAGGLPGSFWCAETGAGGGGSSQWWGRPFYQYGRGVTNPYTTYGNGSTQCALALAGTACREVPDVSIDADEFTPYAEYCTGNSSTPYSDCATFSGGLNPPGWFGAGGTTLSSPFWSAIIADRDSYQHNWSGNINPLLYELANTDRKLYFHDITGKGQTTTNNGLFPTTPGYDEATGLGTPRMAALITQGR